MIPIAALAAVVLLGGAALAVDLSLHTHDRRTLQNVSDAAALAGAQDLPPSPTASDQYAAANDALQVIRSRMGWQMASNTAWSAALAAACGPGSNVSSPPVCDITRTVCSNATPPPSDLPATCDSYATLASNAHFFSITLQTPARVSRVADHADPHYLEVTISQDTQNYVAGVLGSPTSTQGSRSTAYHFGPNLNFGFALFAKTIVQTQNKSTLVVGDVYAERNIAPQSHGQAGFCASGLVVLGTPQDGAPPGPPPPDGQLEVIPRTGPVAYNPGQCNYDGGVPTNSTAGGTVNQGRNPASGCGVSGTTFPAQNDPTVGTCVASPTLSAPTEPVPTLTNPNSNYACVTPTAASPAAPGNYSCTTNRGSALSITSSSAALAPGVYKITHNPSCSPTNCYDVDFSASVSLTGVTFWLDQGATLGVSGNGTTVSINPAPAAVTTSAGDGRFPIYAPPGSVAQVWVTDNGASLKLYGTLYIPDGAAHTFSNGFFQILGQAIVGAWDDKGGNHPTADITYDASRNAPQTEVLQLVE